MYVMWGKWWSGAQLYQFFPGDNTNRHLTRDSSNRAGKHVIVEHALPFLLYTDVNSELEAELETHRCCDTETGSAFVDASTSWVMGDVPTAAYVWFTVCPGCRHLLTILWDTFFNSYPTYLDGSNHPPATGFHRWLIYCNARRKRSWLQGRQHFFYWRRCHLIWWCQWDIKHCTLAHCSTTLSMH